MKKGKVKLRAMEPEDLDVLYEIENDAEMWHIGAVNVPYSRYLLHDYIAHATGDIYTDRQVRLMIENAEGQCVGLVDLVDFNPQHHSTGLSPLWLCHRSSETHAPLCPKGDTSASGLCCRIGCKHSLSASS